MAVNTCVCSFALKCSNVANYMIFEYGQEIEIKMKKNNVFVRSVKSIADNFILIYNFTAISQKSSYFYLGEEKDIASDCFCLNNFIILIYRHSGSTINLIY